MSFDTLTLTAVADELRATIVDGRVQRVVQPTKLSMGLEVYRRGRRQHLLLSAHPQFARVHLSAAKPSRGTERETQLLLLLRKYVVGGRITAVAQPELERVLVLSIAKGVAIRNRDDLDLPDDQPPDDDAWDDDAEPLLSELIVEVMERRANIILVGDDNIIRESVRHVTPQMSRRPVGPHEPYKLPPHQDKRDPRHATADGIRALLKGTETDAARALVGAYRGLAPLAAREVLFRSVGRTDVALAPDLPWAEVAAALRNLWEAPPRPCVAGAGGEPLAFAAYLLTHLPDVAEHPSVSAAVDAFYAAREPLTAHQQRRDRLREQLADARERLDRQRRLLAEQLERARDLDRLRWEGEMIYAFLHQIAPGQTTIEVDGRSIALDPGLTAVDNARERFRAYDKSKSALAGIPERLRATELRLAGLDETVGLLEIADGFEQIETIAREAVDHGYLPRPSDKKPKVRVGKLPPLRVLSADGFAIHVGRSAAQNDHVTFKIGAADDLWLHARGIPGAHVIIKSGGRPVPEQTIVEAAALAAYFSRHRAERAVDVDVSRRSQVRHIHDGPPGLVSYRADRTVRVAPAPPPPPRH